MNVNKFMSNFPHYCLQTFDDKGKDKSLITCGSPNEQYIKRLGELNRKGAGIFFTPNSFPRGKRKAELCTKVNAWFFEIDDVPIDEQWKRINQGPFKPSYIVQTSKSLHCYFLAKNSTIDRFKEIQQGLIQYYGADPACKDISRVLRVPGFYHNKAELIKVKIVSDNERKFTEQEMLDNFPYKEELKEKKISQGSKGNNLDSFWKNASKFDNKVVLERLSGTFLVKGETFSFRPRTSGGVYIDVNGQQADAWIDEQGHIGSGKNGGPTFIQWLEYYGNSKGDIASWIKKNCSDLLPSGVYIKDKNKSDAQTQTKRLLQLFEEEKPFVFIDGMDEAYVQLQIKDKKRIIKCESNQFEKYLNRLYFLKEDELVGKDNLSKVVKLIAAKAEFGNKKLRLFNRVAQHDDNFWYDLSDCKAVCCSKGSWEIIEDVPVLFYAYKHQEKQVLPMKDIGDIYKIFEHIHIKDKNQQILFLVWLVACFVPEIPHPILALFGEKGAAKSTTMRLTRMLIDPSKVDLLSLPRNTELVQQLSHHYVAFYDNVHKIGQTVSDILCRAVTGAGTSKRKLFTDDDDIIYRYRRIIGVNGINNVVQNADLLDRSILVELDRIPKNLRKTEKELNDAFKKDRGIILGGIFDALCKARAAFDDVSLSSYPRMADFAKWGYVIAEVLGYGGEKFVCAYESNINQQNEEVIENNAVANTVVSLLEDELSWEGTPTELYERLFAIAGEKKINMKKFPSSPASLGRQLNVVRSNLLDSGILFESKKDVGGKRGRFYNFVKVTGATDASVAETSESDQSSDGNDGCDDTLLNTIQKEFGPCEVIEEPINS